MNIFKDKNIVITVDGTKYEMDILQIPTSSHVSVEIKGMGKFILLNNNGKLMCLSGDGMTAELLNGIANYLNSHY